MGADQWQSRAEIWCAEVVELLQKTIQKSN